MNIYLKGAAKRLTFLLLVSLGGCAVYPAPYPAYPSAPYGPPAYQEGAYYGPPVLLNFGFGIDGRYRCCGGGGWRR